MRKRFAKLGIQRKVRRFPAADTPMNHHIGCALSHRRIIAEAKQQQLETVLVFEDDSQFSPDAAQVLALAMRELKGREWQLLYLGGYLDKSTVTAVPGCEHLVIANAITCTHAIAYHHTVYDTILNSIPADPVDVAIWIDDHLAIDQFYGGKLLRSAFIVWPVVATQASILPVETREFED